MYFDTCSHECIVACICIISSYFSLPKNYNYNYREKRERGDSRSFQELFVLPHEWVNQKFRFNNEDDDDVCVCVSTSRVCVTQFLFCSSSSIAVVDMVCPHSLLPPVLPGKKYIFFTAVLYFSVVSRYKVSLHITTHSFKIGSP